MLAFIIAVSTRIDNDRPAYRRISQDSVVRVQLLNSIRIVFETTLPEFVIGSKPSLEVTSMEKDIRDPTVYWIRLVADGQKLVAEMRLGADKYIIKRIGSYGTHYARKWRWYFPTSRTKEQFRNLVDRCGKPIPDSLINGEIVTVRHLSGDSSKVHFLVKDPSDNIIGLLFHVRPNHDVDLVFDSRKGF